VSTPKIYFFCKIILDRIKDLNYIADRDNGNTKFTEENKGKIMTLVGTPAQTLRQIVRTYQIPWLHNWFRILKKDSIPFDPRGRGLSISILYKIVEYEHDPPPDGRVDKILRQLLESLKQKYPLNDGKKDKEEVRR